MDYFNTLIHYKDGLSDDVSLIDEAILTLENYFDCLNGDTLLHRSRPLAIAYLALKEIKDTGSADRKNTARYIEIEMQDTNTTAGLHRKYIGCSNCHAPIPTDDALDAVFDEDIHYCLRCGSKIEK